MTGWGQDGPDAGTAGPRHHLRRRHRCPRRERAAVRRPPMPPLNLLGDFAGAHLSGRRAARRAARVADVAASARSSTPPWSTAPRTSRRCSTACSQRAPGRTSPGSNLLDGGAPFYGIYRTSDGGWMAVGALEPAFYDELLGRLGIDPADGDRNDPSSWPALRQRIADAFATRTRDEWTEVFAGSDACVAPVLGLGRGDPAPAPRSPAARSSSTPASCNRPRRRASPARRRRSTGRRPPPASTPTRSSPSGSA